MSKRRLSDQQTRRIKAQQNSQQARVKTPSASNDSHLGPEQQGLVISHFRAQADVQNAISGEVVRCHLRANLGALVAGDQVIWRAEEPKGVVVAVLPRTSSIVRPDSYGKLKLVAANITRALIVIAPEPAAHGNLIDRYLVMLEHLGIEPVLVVNKVDLLSAEHPLRALLATYAQLQYPILHLSAHQPETLVALRELLVTGISIVVGQSGVGKSSILQTLLPDEALKIGELSEAISKGRHTTTHARLYHFPNGGSCIDSPGIREFGLWHLQADDVAQGFVEFRPYLGGCKFRNCQHQSEPGCRLLQALADGVIGAGRFASYQQIIASLGDVTLQTSEL